MGPAARKENPQRPEKGVRSSSGAVFPTYRTGNVPDRPVAPVSEAGFMSLIPVLVLVWVIGIPLLVGAIATASRAYHRRTAMDCHGVTPSGPGTWEAPPVEGDVPIAMEAWASRLTRERVSRG
jgi:hypothetical protein